MKIFPLFSEGFKQIWIRNFNLCLFVSLCILSIYHRLADSWTGGGYGWFYYFFIPAFNGLFTAFICHLLNNYLARKKYTQKYYSASRLKLMVVAFTAGFLSLYLIINDVSTYFVTLLVIYIAFLNIREFVQSISELLTPNKMATLKDISSFFNFFINLIITYAVINLSLNAIHGNLGIDKAFNFDTGIPGIVDALYFSVITMTTVGYGDIFPQTTIAKVIVAFECLTCYIMLGIMIGIINRGIKIEENK